MKKSSQFQENQPSALFIPAGEDRFGEYRGLGISSINFKLISPDTKGILIIENDFHENGGPPRHMHHDQDEWFFVVRGEFVFEVGERTFKLRPGDSLLAPRSIPHVWAYVGGAQGKILIAFMPAGNMESFFRKVAQTNAMPSQNPELWRAHNMELLGPPLDVL